MRASHAGFTLLEMLLVILLVGTLASMVIPASGISSAMQARQQAGGLIQLLQSGRQSALLESREYGVRFQTDQVQLMRLGATGWQPVDAPLALAAGFTWQLYLAGLAVGLDETTAIPQVLLLSSDELTPFTLHLADAQRRWLTVASDGLAEPTVEEPSR